MEREFQVHGTYIKDYPGFELVKKLGRDEAFGMLARSHVITGKKPTRYDPEIQDRQPFLLNKGWAVTEINREQGYIDAVYAADGLYYLYRSGVQSFIDRIRQTVSWNATLRQLYERLTEPHEYA